MYNHIFFNSLMIIFLAMIINQVGGTANNSLSDCQAVAANFRTTVSGPVSNIASTSGINTTCGAYNIGVCPGSNVSGFCVFPHKLAVSCYLNGSTVKIRVQSNGLPLFCPGLANSTNTTELNIDFVTNFNPDVSVKSPLQNATTASGLSNILCNLQQTATPPTSSGFINYGVSYSGLTGVSIDGVPIFNPNTANNLDPFYPPSSSSIEQVDDCLGHIQNGVYHYHMVSACPKGNTTFGTISCNNTPTCNASLSQYGISTYANYTTLTVIGIALDGHVIYGPYTAAGAEVTSGTDICNGMFYDSIGNYAYFTTRKFPYAVGCFGPGNYPNVSVNCSTNAPSAYTMSTYASVFMANNTNSTSDGKKTTSTCFQTMIYLYCLVISTMIHQIFFNV